MIQQEPSLQNLTESWLTQLLAEVGRAAPPGFDPQTSFKELGIDSFHVLKIIKRLESDFGRLPKTLLFEHFNVESLAKYFVRQHERALRGKFSLQEKGSLLHKGSLQQNGALQPPAASQQTAPQPVGAPESIAAPLFLSEKAAYADPVLQPLVARIFAEFRSEGSVSRGTRCIAPYLFIGAARRGYFHCARGGKRILLVYAYTGPEDYSAELAGELLTYCRARDLSLNLLSGAPIESIGAAAFSSTPFGAIQRIRNLQQFTLEGGAMRRLRYQVTKFEKAGACRTVEYRCGTDPDTERRIVELIDEWSESKGNVNPLVGIVRAEILSGRLDEQHRLFVTYVDDVIHNVILISALAKALKGYLMDLEFYSRSMPLGGLEFAIARIIAILASEGCELLSLGGTYGCRLETSPHADAAVNQVLDELQQQSIFNDSGNLQFKNKFRPENTSIYLCRERGCGAGDEVLDIIMMIADPSSMAAAPEVDAAPVSAAQFIRGERRSLYLSEARFNPLSLAAESVEIDLKTDSWAQLRLPVIETRMRQLHAQLQHATHIDSDLKRIFPFNHFVLTPSGRTAEKVFYKAWENKGRVPQNLLFPTGIYHQIDNGFAPLELPCAEAFRLDAQDVYKGNLSWGKLVEKIGENPQGVAFVCIEVGNNAAGGAPVALTQLREVKALLAKHAIPLVLDATRAVANAQLLIQHEAGNAERGLWPMVREILACADVVLCSLAKEFCVNKGGLIATNDPELARRMREIAHEESASVDLIDKQLMALALRNTREVEGHIQRRLEHVRRVGEALTAAGVPVVTPVGGHCVLLDVKQVPEFQAFEAPVPSFLAWLYLNTGIRAAAHNVGMQKGTALNDLVRLAIPLGLGRESVGEIIDRTVAAFRDKRNIPELVPLAQSREVYADVGAPFSLKRYHNLAGELLLQWPVEVPAATEESAAPVPRDVTVAPLPAAEEPIVAPPMSASAGADIAIVGMSGRYPGAKNLTALWQNLLQGKDCITELPPERRSRRLNCRTEGSYRGGFIEGIDRFDSLFFNISPREAAMLDPQERLFLEVAWEALEDAGYYPETLVREGAPRDVGVFVGAVWTMYQMLRSEELYRPGVTVPNSFLWSIANRVSYWMNLSGPSLTLDTACSSSLTALYLACEAIRSGQCSAALVGGVNLDLHRTKLEINLGGGALSPDGLCRSFGRGANGYVAGEGVGALLLKPLEQAVADGDHVYGVIKSVVVNHGGRTNGYTVPNPAAQASLIRSALTKAAIDARSIGYIEAHGTGTELGDPVEIAGLSQAFEPDAVARQSCSIGSVKSNIGHLEAAAGVVSISKVLLQMRHRRLVPSLHSAELNELIDFGSSPFTVQQHTEQWRGKVVGGVELPLRAGVSSFGAGGSNAHVILESRAPADDSRGESPHFLAEVFPLSAKTAEQLRAAVERLQGFIQQDRAAEPGVQCKLGDIAYTLQIGRRSFEHRIAVLAADKATLQQRLDDFLAGTASPEVLIGHIKNADGLTRILSRDERHEFVALLAQRRDPRKLAELWVDGLLADWRAVRPPRTGKRVPLPTYPFADKRHWAIETGVVARGGRVTDALHPLIDANESTFGTLRLRKAFHESEFVLREHRVGDIPTLPGVAYLELARKAGELAAGRTVRKITNILWVSPIAVRSATPQTVFIELQPHGDTATFEVFSEGPDHARTLHSQGKLTYATQDPPPDEHLDLQAIRSRTLTTLDGQAVYPRFNSAGLNLGPGFQVLRQVHKGKAETLGVLSLSEARRGDLSEMLLHPGLVDGSLQAGVAAKLDEPAAEMLVPFTIGEVEILHPLPPECFSYVTEPKDDKSERSKVVKSNVAIVDSTGRVLVRMRDVVGVPLREVHQKQEAPDRFEELHYGYDWQKAALSLGAPPPLPAAIVLFDTAGVLRGLFEQRLRDDRERLISVEQGAHYEKLSAGAYRINPGDPEHFRRLFADLAQARHEAVAVCFAWSVPNDASEPPWQAGIFPLVSACQAIIHHKLEATARLLYLHDAGTAALHDEAVDGFLKSLRMEHPKLVARLVSRDAADTQRLADDLLAEWHAGPQLATAVCYRGADRYVRMLRRLSPEDTTPVIPAQTPAGSAGARLKENGVYLITGGAGGLGLLFAQFLATEYHARLILCGRSKLSEAQQARLKALTAAGAEVLYCRADVGNRAAVEKLVVKGKQRFGRIDGIIHAAGVLRDSYVRNKTREDMQAVFAPKILGVAHLDAATSADALDFFVTFSSLAAIAGNAGQSDYAFANRYMDLFAERRERQRAQRARHGKTLSVNWSLWADGGMQLDAPTRTFFESTLGIRPIQRDQGLAAFVRALASDRTQLAVIDGVQSRIETAWGMRSKPAVTPVAGRGAARQTLQNAEASAAASSAAPPPSQEELRARVEQELTRIAMDFLHLEAGDVAPDKILLELGFDSIGLTTYANSINERYGLEITPVLFFDHPSIGHIAAYLLAEHGAQLSRLHESNTAATATQAVQLPVTQPAPAAPLPQPTVQPYEPAPRVGAPGLSVAHRFAEQPIAIVGMSGVMPQSASLEEFWDNLENARDLITVVPPERWRWEDYYGDPLKEANKSNSRWGGFMPDVDKFDPLFFGISPREAQMMDPQQRIFLQTVWQAIEDSGHKVSDFSGTRTGLFVGVATNDYIDLMNDRKIALDGYSASGNSHSVLANRVSFLLNLRGPSAPLDTACSSSLVAIHRAVESIHTGSCDMAIAGGVQVMLTPAAYISFGAAGMLSSDGHCKTFDKRANGYVRGEGAGAIVLKPLSKAEADGDHIYAVIKATAENHGGKVTTLTAPNATAQTELLIEAYDKARVDPTTVGYIECHGTGTPLGDPIEIQALTRSFAELYKRNGNAPPAEPHCGLSAVKTNIGHLETAAGIASILKALLAIQHRKIPASLHFEEINPYINLKGTPFYIVGETSQWQPPRASDGTPLPRRAGVSSFGFGGANAHIVLEEYVPAAPPVPAQPNSPQIIILSAKTPERLLAYGRAMATYLRMHTVDLCGFAYTLQLGRDEMPERVAFVAADMQELCRKLDEFVADPGRFSAGYRGTVRSRAAAPRGAAESVEAREVGASIERADWENLAQLWVAGARIEWAALHVSRPHRLALPTYPFARERHWLPEQGERRTREAVMAVERLHPMIHRNVSSLQEQKFTSHFTGKEFFLADHAVRGQSVLPGVGYLEMARVAGQLSAASEVTYLRNIVWMTPLVVGAAAKDVEIALAPNADEVDFTVRTVDGAQIITHCRGKLGFKASTAAIPMVDIEAIRARCTEEIQGDDLYDFLCTSELQFGKGLRVVRSVCANRSECLAVLELHESAREDARLYGLHPGLMDGSLHTAIGMVKKREPGLPWALPYSVGEVNLLHSLKDLRYGYATWDTSGLRDEQAVIRMSFQLLDERGRVLLRMKDLIARPFREGAARSIPIEGIDVPKSAGPAAAASSQLHSLVPVWNPLYPQRDSTLAACGRLLLLNGSNDARSWVQRCYPDLEVAAVGAGASIEDLATELGAHSFEQLLWIAPDVTEPDTSSPAIDIIVERQEQGVIAVFRTIKALLRLGYASRGLRWTLITRNTCNVSCVDRVLPTHATVSGLVGSLAKEFPHWSLRLLDVDTLDGLRADACLALPWDKQGNGLAYRKGEWLEQGLARMESLPATHCAYRHHGVYVVVGGAGGLGELWSRFVMEHFQARVIWIGRQGLNAAITAKIDALAQFGEPPLYVSADATDLTALEGACRQILSRYPAIHGVLHSAIVLRDQSLTQMDESAFRAACDAKLRVAVNLERVFGSRDLDFMLFFSSIMSFSRAPGQANYAAGCTFKDSFAHALRQQHHYAVKTMNWGYWGDRGVVADSSYRKLMEGLGVGSIEPAEGMQALQALLGCDAVSQLALVRTLNDQARAALSVREALTCLPAAFPDDTATEVSLQDAAVERSKPAAALAAEMPSEETNTLVTRILAASLADIGALGPGTGDSVGVAAAAAARMHQHWLDTSIRYLQQQQLLDADRRPVRPVGALGELWSTWELHKTQQAAAPHRQAQAMLLETCLKALPDILRGRKAATDVLFPGSSMKLLEGVYRGNPVADYFNSVLGDTLSGCVAGWLAATPERRVRILEIGAGTGGTTDTVLPGLARFGDAVEEYCYSDLSQAFLMYGAERFRSQCCGFTTAVFDVSRPLAAQGRPAGHYDAVIAANVLHATADIRRTLRNAKASLRKGGILLLNEISTWSLFSHLTFGLLEGWWLHEDLALRIPGCPGLTAESWEAVLRSEGFVAVRFPARDQHVLGQQVIVAVSDGVTRQRLPAGLPTRQPDTTAAVVPAATRRQGPQPISTEVTDQMRDYVRRILIRHLSEALKLDASLVRDDVPFADYGVDSIVGVDLVRQIGAALQVELQTTSLFEHSTLDQLTTHICTSWNDVLASQLGQVVNPTPVAPAPAAVARFQSESRERFSPAAAPARAAAGPNRPDRIAIIGMSGRFAQSASLEEFWEHLQRGDELVTDVTRWPASACIVTHTPGRTYCSRGSFVESIDRFDPAFFRIPEEEARHMDPQQRLFLEESWKALEDAGYAGKDVQELQCGVYVGCGSSNYQELFQVEPPPQAFWGNSESVIPARIAYHLNLRGPAIAVNTACSSSLVTIHLACQALWSGETDMALAGGVFLQATPSFYQVTNGAGMLSVSGHCRSFDAHADGFVPGEGVGVIVLKRLDDALRDADHIHGVIAASGINQDGSSNGLIAPNGAAQERLERAVYERFEIDPASIQMLEAHGTGTLLGDSIEYEAISRAFRRSTPKQQYCALGSVKTNIGHAATAAGIASVLKVLLSLRHRQIPPSLGFQAGNPGINFAASPFYINTALSAWELGAGDKRRAAVSAFGFSGTNAHLVIEEAPQPERVCAQQPGYLVVLSARSRAQLGQQVANLLTVVKHAPQISMPDLSYSLIVGRMPLAHRLACVARNAAELVELLQRWNSDGEATHVYTGEVRERRGERATFKKFASYCMEACRNAASAESYVEHLEAIADLYAQGTATDLRPLLSPGCGRIPLPTYPFARERYWIDGQATRGGAARADRAVRIHPLVHRNISDLRQQRYISSFTAADPLLREHRPGGPDETRQCVLPELLLLEMVRAAVENASPVRRESSALTLSDITWGEPVVVSRDTDVMIALSPCGNEDRVDFEIYSACGEREVVHCQGRALLTHSSAAVPVDIQRLRNEMSRGPRQTLAPIHVPLEDSQGRAGEFMLPPALLGALLDVARDLTSGRDGAMPNELAPLALQSLRVAAGCTGELFVWARHSAGVASASSDGTLDIDVLDSRGLACAQLRGLSLKTADAVEARATARWEFCRGPVHAAESGASIVGSLSDIDKMELFLQQEVASQLRQPLESIELDRNYFDLGVSSLGITQLVRATNVLLEENISPRVIFEYRDIRSFAAHLAAAFPARVAAVTAIRHAPGKPAPVATNARPALRRMKPTGRPLTTVRDAAQANGLDKDHVLERVASLEESDAAGYEKLTF